MSKIKEIYCMHHSHLDIGYTHPQPMLLELQRDYIDQAIDLCLKTADYPEESQFRWTCEATYPVFKWLETASEDRIEAFRKLLLEGRICISALPMHTTPLTNVVQMTKMMKPAELLRKQFDIPIRTAINHDVNGQPWTMSQILKDSGVEFYLTGINVHFGGIPFKRPAVFRWETPDKRELLTFLGEHYSLFSQFFFTSENSTELMDKGVKEYVNRIEEGGYAHDFVLLTATNPPLYDNNCPDFDLADLIRKYNEEGHEQKIRFVTPEMLYERVKKIDRDSIPVYKGDWTDFWNFGSASSAKETRVNRKAKQNLAKAEFLEAFSKNPGKHHEKAKNEAYLNTLLYDEHTWGASQSIADPTNEEVYSQRLHKAEMAYKAADLSAYVLGKQAELFADNPLQSIEPEGIILINTSSTEQKAEIRVPESLTLKGRQLAAARIKQFLPYEYHETKKSFLGTVKLAPFSWRKIPLSEIESHVIKAEKGDTKPYNVIGETLETPFYKVTFDPATGRIKQIHDRKRGWNMLNEESPWTFFEFVRETIDPLKNPEKRTTFFPRDLELGNRSISVWNHGWKGKREGAKGIEEWKIEEEQDSVSFVIKLKADGMESLEQRIRFFVHHPKIEMTVRMNKQGIETPEGIYFVFPMNLEEGWKSNFDSAGASIELDVDQLGNVSRDWVTVDQTVSVYDGGKGVTLACPDAPMVQIGGFNFGKESKRVERIKNPLLLAWPMNNYWDTNFWASQPGVITLKYEMLPFEQFDPVLAHNFGVEANEPAVISACVNCPKEESGILFDGKGEGIVPLSIRPADHGGVIVMLKNMTDAACQYTFSIPGKTISKASVVNVLEEKLSDLSASDQQVKLELAPGSLVQVHATFN